MSKPKVIEGDLVCRNSKFGIVVARFNSFITESLLKGALDTLKRHGAEDSDIEVVWVPGAYELPLAVKVMADKGGYDAIIALGCVIRGGTPHFEYVAAEVHKGIARVSLDEGLPVIHGIITADNLEQAIERAGAKEGNRGFAAATSAMEMANLMKSVIGQQGTR